MPTTTEPAPTDKRFQLKPVPLLTVVVVGILLSTSIRGCQELGAISRQLRDTQRHLDAASQRIDSVYTNMQVLRARLTDARTQIAAIDASVEALETNLGRRISGLDGNLARLRGNLTEIDALLESRRTGASIDPNLPQPVVLDVH